MGVRVMLVNTDHAFGSLNEVNTYFVVDFLSDSSNPLPHGEWFKIVVIIYSIYYYALIVWLVKDELAEIWQWAQGAWAWYFPNAKCPSCKR